MNVRYRSWTLLVVLVVGLAGCGSDSSTDTLSAAEWRTEASAICKRFGRQIGAVEPPRGRHDLPSFIAAVAPLWKEQLDATRRLSVPEELEESVAGYDLPLSDVSRWLVEMHIAMDRRDSGRFDEARGNVQGSAEAMREAARSLGLRTCARQRIPTL